MKFFLFFSIVCFFSCTKVPETKTYMIPRNVDVKDTSQVYFSGFYNTVNDVDEKYFSLREVVFCKNGKIKIWNGASYNQEALTCDFYKKVSKNQFGSFAISQNVIDAYLPVVVIKRGMVYKTLNAHYQGYIKNRDTIINWKIVPPFPKEVGKWEVMLENNKKLFSPQTLYFVKTDAVKCLQKN